MAGATTTTQTSWASHPKIRGPTEPIQLFLLTCSLIGLQFCWGTEMTYCTPYLLSLGLSKSMLSLVWVAGPLSGLVMQPVVGMVSDGWSGRWGRRRPFMVGGSVGVVVLLVALGWMGDLVGLWVGEGERVSECKNGAGGECVLIRCGAETRDHDCFGGGGYICAGLCHQHQYAMDLWSSML